MIGTYFDGSGARFVHEIDLARFVSLAPRPTWRAAAIIVGWVLAQLVLLRFLPGKWFDAPITPQGNQPRYRVNGIAAWLVTHLGLLLGFFAGLWSPASVYRQLGSLLVTLNLGALAFCGFLYWKGRRHPSSTDAVYSGHFIFDFFQGTELHPTLFGTSLKQLINCRVSMMGWSLLVLCCLGYQYETFGSVASSMLVSAGLLVLSVQVLLLGKRVSHLARYHARSIRLLYLLGRLGVGARAVHHFGAYLATHPIQLSLWWSLLLSAACLISLWMNYAADAQRQRVRATDGKTTVWGKPPRILRAPT